MTVSVVIVSGGSACEPGQATQAAAVAQEMTDPTISRAEAVKMAQPGLMSMCPMAETCMSMMEKRLSGVVMMIPGITFISVGVLIVLWPSVLPWLVAAASILAGVAMLMMANFMRGMGDRLRRTRGFPASAPAAPGPRMRQ